MLLVVLDLQNNLSCFLHKKSSFTRFLVIRFKLILAHIGFPIIHKIKVVIIRFVDSKFPKSFIENMLASPILLVF